MATSAIGGLVTSALITKLVEKVCSYAGDQYEYQRIDTKEKLRILEKNLLSIQTVLHIAERVQARNTSMGSWLRRIKDAACQAEDVLDLFDYRVLQAQAEDKERVNSVASAAAGSSSSATTTTTTASTTTTSSSSGSTVNQWVCVLKRFLFSDEDIDELISVVDLFADIDSKIQTFLKLVKLEDSRPERAVQWRTTTSMLGSREFFGLVNQEEHLKKSLVMINEHSSLPYDVISVVGIGGVGKTALVQSVYNHLSVTHHFDLAVWLHVSDDFSVGRLTKEMAQSDNLSISAADLNSISSLDEAQKILRKKLNGKRALIVLDDVWNELRSQMENLCKPIKFAAKGTKVIVTTRSKKVASMNEPTEIMHLHGLEDEDYWRLFSQYAFGDAIPSDFPQLENIGRQVVKKLAGSPLAAKTVGDSLKLKLEENHWRAVCGRKLWQIEQKEDDIISSLRLSYEHLPGHLKQCFVYFALFPKKYHFQGDVLIQMWRAQGFINMQTPDDTARLYIDDLLQLLFIEKVANQQDHYVVHDLLHDFAESVSNGEHFRIEDGFHVCIPRNVRHIYVSASNISKVFISLQEFQELKKNMRSLIICKAEEGASRKGKTSSNFNHVLEETLQQLRSLRVLVLSNLDGVLPKNMDKLVHLRYLDIHESGSFISVSKSLFKLYHLHGLNLNKLTLWWNHLKQNSSKTDHEGVFEGLRPNSNLRELCVRGYMGINSPSWLSCKYLPNIHSIELLFCRRWTTLPSLGSLPFLRILKIKHLTMVENIDAGFYGHAAVAFPALEELLFEGMPEWKVWSAIESSQQVFPRLRDICIKNCDKLMGPLPLPSFNQMQISVSDLTSEKIISCESENTADVNTPYRVQLSLDRLGLLRGCLPTSRLATIHMLDISSYYLKVFNMEQDEWLQQLTSLKELRFTDCLALRTLPSNMMHLTSLETLHIESCPELVSSPQMRLPLSLKKLIGERGDLTGRRLPPPPETTSATAKGGLA